MSNKALKAKSRLQKEKFSFKVSLPKFKAPQFSISKFNFKLPKLKTKQKVVYAEQKKTSRLPAPFKKFCKTCIQWLQGYWKYLQIFTISIFFYLIVFFIVTRIHAHYLANIPLPDTYLLFQLPLLGGNFFFFTFLFQSRRWGLWFAVTIFLILFFQLGHFIFSAGVIIFIVSFSLFILTILFLPIMIREKSSKLTISRQVNHAPRTQATSRLLKK